MAPKRGLLISLEGIDGSGKTTQANLVENALSELGYKVKYTQEPSKGKIGLLLREYLSDPNSSPFVDALLFAADRIEHYENEIKPNLERGISVITDRYLASSIVYQGSQGVPFSWVEFVNNRVPVPDIHLYIDIDIQTALKRISKASRDVIEKFEQEETLLNIYNGYKQLINRKWFTLIDGNGTIEEVTKRLVQKIEEKLTLN